MNGIIYDARRVMAYEALLELGKYAGKEIVWLDELWKGLLEDSDQMTEFMYYLDHHTFLDNDKCCGYGLCDLYVWQMDRYNLVREIGKNTVSCNKETMVLNAFLTMQKLKADPQIWLKRITSGEGMDQL